MVKRFCIQIMSIVLVLAICHSQMDYFFVYKLGLTKDTMSKSETLNDLFDIDDESSDQDESQKEGKSFPLFCDLVPKLLAFGQISSTSRKMFCNQNEQLLINPNLDSIYQPPRAIYASQRLA